MSGDGQGASIAADRLRSQNSRSGSCMAPLQMGNHMTLKALVLPLLLAASISALTGCAGTPPPRQALDSAEAGIELARKLGAQEHAATELARAVQRLDEAHAASSMRDQEDAARLAREAELDARLAQELARAAVAREDVRRLTDENARLRRDLLGQGGAR